MSEDNAGVISPWSAIRKLFVRHAEAFVKSTRYEEASAIADKAAREIEELIAPSVLVEQDKGSSRADALHTQPGADGAIVGSNKRRTPDMEVAIGAAIRALRERADLSMAEAGRRLGVTFQAVQRFENGKSRVSLSTAIELCRVMQVPTGALLEVLSPIDQRASITLIRTGPDGTERTIRYDTDTAPLHEIIPALARDAAGSRGLA